MKSNSHNIQINISSNFTVLLCEEEIVEDWKGLVDSLEVYGPIQGCTNFFPHVLLVLFEMCVER